MTSGQAKDTLDIYGSLAARDLAPTVQSGRYSYQAEAERRILADVLAKLRIEPHHRVLDIGAGVGLLSIPLTFVAAHVTAIDSPASVEAIGRRFRSDRLTLVGGRFPEALPAGEYDRIAFYGVVPALSGIAEMHAMALAAAAMLAPGGRMLIGDVRNSDRQARFRASDDGQRFEAAWRAQTAADDVAAAQDAHATEAFRGTVALGGITDAQLFDLMLMLRTAGFETFLHEQPPELPFGNSREDVIVVRH